MRSVRFSLLLLLTGLNLLHAQNATNPNTVSNGTTETTVTGTGQTSESQGISQSSIDDAINPTANLTAVVGETTRTDTTNISLNMTTGTINAATVSSPYTQSSATSFEATSNALSSHSSTSTLTSQQTTASNYSATSPPQSTALKSGPTPTSNQTTTSNYSTSTASPAQSQATFKSSPTTPQTTTSNYSTASPAQSTASFTSETQSNSTSTPEPTIVSTFKQSSNYSSTASPAQPTTTFKSETQSRSTSMQTSDSTLLMSSNTSKSTTLTAAAPTPTSEDTRNISETEGGGATTQTDGTVQQNNYTRPESKKNLSLGLSDIRATSVSPGITGIAVGFIIVGILCVLLLATLLLIIHSNRVYKRAVKTSSLEDKDPLSRSATARSSRSPERKVRKSNVDNDNYFIIDEAPTTYTLGEEDRSIKSASISMQDSPSYNYDEPRSLQLGQGVLGASAQESPVQKLDGSMRAQECPVADCAGMVDVNTGLMHDITTQQPDMHTAIGQVLPPATTAHAGSKRIRHLKQ